MIRIIIRNEAGLHTASELFTDVTDTASELFTDVTEL